MKGGGAAGAATIGAAGVEVVQQAVTDTQSALQPLIPYLDTIRWLFLLSLRRSGERAGRLAERLENTEGGSLSASKRSF